MDRVCIINNKLVYFHFLSFYVSTWFDRNCITTILKNPFTYYTSPHQRRNIFVESDANDFLCSTNLSHTVPSVFKSITEKET